MLGHKSGLPTRGAGFLHTETERCKGFLSKGIMVRTLKKVVLLKTVVKQQDDLEVGKIELQGNTHPKKPL